MPQPLSDELRALREELGELQARVTLLERSHEASESLDSCETGRARRLYMAFRAS